jgi:hypothetical protein
MITLDDYLTTSGKHRDRLQWVSPAVQANAEVTVTRVNALFLACGFSRKVSGGFRDMLTNKATRGADAYSRHQTGEACDLEDWDGRLKEWARKNADALANIGLWCEPLHMTPTWLHVQTTPVPGGQRVTL